MMRVFQRVRRRADSGAVLLAADTALEEERSLKTRGDGRHFWQHSTLDGLLAGDVLVYEEIVLHGHGSMNSNWNGEL